MTECAICGKDAGPSPRMGEPVCRGPVCRWCYETKVLRAGDTPPQHTCPSDLSKGGWAVRTPKGIVTGTDPWYIAEAMAESGMLDPDMRALGLENDARGWCECAEKEIELCPAVQGRDWEIGGRTVRWFGPAMLYAPSRTLGW